MDWDARGIILHRDSLKARKHVIVRRASSDGQVSKYSPEPELLVKKLYIYEKYIDI